MLVVAERYWCAVYLLHTNGKLASHILSVHFPSLIQIRYV